MMQPSRPDLLVLSSGHGTAPVWPWYSITWHGGSIVKRSKSMCIIARKHRLSLIEPTAMGKETSQAVPTHR